MSRTKHTSAKKRASKKKSSSGARTDSTEPAARKKAPSKKAPSKKGASKKRATKKTATKKTATKKTATKKTAAKKTAAKKRATKKRATKKTAATKPAPRIAAPGAAPIVFAEEKQAPKSFQRYYDKWRQRLIQLRRRLLGETSQLEEEALRANEDEVSVDHMADYGSDSYEQEFTLSLIESKSEALRDVDEALRRIQSGAYGLCEECETMIPKGRLEVLPHARYCITCKSAMESQIL